MNAAYNIIRILMGLLFLFASITVLANLFPEPELTGIKKTFMDGIKASGYLLPLIKITELVCGISFVSGYFVPLAAIVIAPVIVNIFLYHIFVDSTGLPVAIFLIAANGFVAFYHREKYKALLQA